MRSYPPPTHTCSPEGCTQRHPLTCILLPRPRADYFGVLSNTAARVAALAAPGQVLIECSQVPPPYVADQPAEDTGPAAPPGDVGAAAPPGLKPLLREAGPTSFRTEWPAIPMHLFSPMVIAVATPSNTGGGSSGSPGPTTEAEHGSSGSPGHTTEAGNGSSCSPGPATEAGHGSVGTLSPEHSGAPALGGSIRTQLEHRLSMVVLEEPEGGEQDEARGGGEDEARRGSEDREAHNGEVHLLCSPCTPQQRRRRSQFQQAECANQPASPAETIGSSTGAGRGTASGSMNTATPTTGMAGGSPGCLPEGLTITSTVEIQPLGTFLLRGLEDSSKLIYQACAAGLRGREFEAAVSKWWLGRAGWWGGVLLVVGQGRGVGWGPAVLLCCPAGHPLLGSFLRPTSP